MFVLLVLCVLWPLGASAPTAADAEARALAYTNDNDGLGNYEFSFETSNGIRRQETGRLVNEGEPDEHLVVKGSYSYLNPEGNLVVVNYTADENGYRTDEGQPLPQLEFPPQVVASAPLSPAAVATLLG